MFCVGKLSMHWKRIRIVSSSVRCLYSNEFTSALTEHLLPCPCDLCVHVTAFLIVFMSWNAEIQSMWLGGITCAWLARLFGTTPNEEGFKERKMHPQLSVSVCRCCMGICCCIALTCCHVLTCDWRQQVVRVRAAAPRVFFNSKYLFPKITLCT